MGKAKRPGGEPGLSWKLVSLRIDDVPDHPAWMWGSGRRAREVMPEAIRALVVDRGCALHIGRECSHAAGTDASGQRFSAGGMSGTTVILIRRRLPGSTGSRDR